MRTQKELGFNQAVLDQILADRKGETKDGLIIDLYYCHDGWINSVYQYSTDEMSKEEVNECISILQAYIEKNRDYEILFARNVEHAQNWCDEYASDHTTIDKDVCVCQHGKMEHWHLPYSNNISIVICEECFLNADLSKRLQ